MAVDRNPGLTADPLFVGLTRPAMAFGVTYAALLVNLVVTMEAFIVTRQLLWLLTFLPVHGLFYLVCRYEPRFFDLLLLWGQTRGLGGVAGNLRHWRANSHAPLPIDLPDRAGRRRATPAVVAL